MLINNLSFKFDKNSDHYFFRDLTIELTSNEVHFIQGDNGIGKSTLFNILQGTNGSNVLLNASVTLDGTNYSAQNNILPPTFTQHVHTVQQNYESMIANQFTFIENLQLAKLPTYPALRSLPEAIVFGLVVAMGIDVKKPAYLLSGGQKQLLAILMALQKPTKLLLLDEPTATLDKNNAKMVMDCLYSLAEQLQVTILIICHDRELVNQYRRASSFIMKKLENGERVVLKGFHEYFLS